MLFGNSCALSRETFSDHWFEYDNKAAETKRDRGENLFPGSFQPTWAPDWWIPVLSPLSAAHFCPSPPPHMPFQLYHNTICGAMQRNRSEKLYVLKITAYFSPVSVSWSADHVACSPLTEEAVQGWKMRSRGTRVGSKRLS